jgi:hypothetical protein
MARYNEILIGRWNRFAQKITGIKGPPPVPTLSSDVQLVHPFFHDNENRFIEGWGKFGFQAQIGAAAGQNPTFVMQNPVNSNVIVVVEKMTFADVSATAQGIKIGMAGVDTQGNPAGNGSGLDGRAYAGSPPGQGGTVTKSVTTFRSASIAGPATTFIFWQSAVVANGVVEVILDDHQELVLAPSEEFVLFGTTFAATLVMSVWFRERFLEDSERA